MNDFAAQLTQAMSQYSGAVSEEIEKALKDVGKQTVKKVKDLSPERTKGAGSYKRGWTAKVERQTGSVKVTVYNRKKYRLTHLLEHGHQIKGGGKTKAKPHIAPAEQFAEAEAMKAIEKAVKG
jgi:hypothetical protein